MRLNPIMIAALPLFMVAACGNPAPKAPAETIEAETPPVEEADISPLEAAIASPLRSEAEIARDAYRHPAETLDFFGIEPDDTVIELWPGGGWYTNILAPYLASGDGTLVAALFDPESVDDPERQQRIRDNNAAFQEEHTGESWGTIDYTVFSASSGPLVEPGSADAVLTFRNVHNWMAGDYEEKFFEDAFEALKPGGVLGVVDHRLPSTAVQAPNAPTGYVHEDYVISLAKAAGFDFDGSSEVNANPEDTADHPFGVWTLPPVSRTTDRDGNTPDDFDAEKYAAIGESDRMTLRFVKPLAAEESPTE